MERYYEESDNREKCKHWLASIESCRQCLFETLCHLEKQKEKRAKEGD